MYSFELLLYIHCYSHYCEHLLPFIVYTLCVLYVYCYSPHIVPYYWIPDLHY